MIDDRALDKLKAIEVPAPDQKAREQALAAAMRAFAEQKNASTAQGTENSERLIDRARKLWSEIMHKKLLSTSALAGLVALPLAGYAAFYLTSIQPFAIGEYRPSNTSDVRQLPEEAPVATGPSSPDKRKVEADQPEATLNAAESAGIARTDAAKADQSMAPPLPTQPETEALSAPVMQTRREAAGLVGGRARKMIAQPTIAPVPMPQDIIVQAEPDRDRVETFDTNPVKSAAEHPVSTFSIDADTASYSYVRRSLKEGVLPQPDTVRVEEMVNYFPYDWRGPQTAAAPFNSTVTVMPTPWNTNTKLMHVAIKGFDVQPAEQPKANLVFLIDVSGSMDEPDKLPLLRTAFRMLVNKLRPDDTVSIVTYAGNAGTVLEPTKLSDKAKILNAIDTLEPGGSTAGEAGIREAYRLAEQSFVKDGINRVMLATDGDFNVGQTDDTDLKRLVEEKRKSGVFLSVFGFGRGNLNDQMMQTIAQNGNGTAAYIDTLQEAEKVLVEDASSTLFPIAKDVKIQVEFNPAKISEYRLIGYETRALAREDFNNDKVDAGEIGSGHSVTAIYEVTPKGSPAQTIDDLRYAEPSTSAAQARPSDEYAFVKIRYKLPNEDVSKLITTPVTSADEVGSFAAAGVDQRFSVAVAAFGQKLRDTSQIGDFDYGRIAEIAAGAKGGDPFGYRAEFVSMVRLAAAMSDQPKPAEQR